MAVYISLQLILGKNYINLISFVNVPCASVDASLSLRQYLVG
jgi:hypothetical protein